MLPSAPKARKASGAVHVPQTRSHQERLPSEGSTIVCALVVDELSKVITEVHLPVFATFSRPCAQFILDFPPNLPFRWSPIGEGFAINEDAGRKHDAATFRERSPLRWVDRQGGNRQWIFARQSFEHILGNFAE